MTVHQKDQKCFIMIFKWWKFKVHPQTSSNLYSLLQVMDLWVKLNRYGVFKILIIVTKKLISYIFILLFCPSWSCTIISCINIFTSLCKNLLNLLEFLAEVFRCHLHHFQCLTVPVKVHNEVNILIRVYILNWIKWIQNVS